MTQNKNPWATEYGRPPIEKDDDGEWSDEEQKLFDHWERDLKMQEHIYKNEKNKQSNILQSQPKKANS